MPSLLRTAFPFLPVALAACSFYSTATHWHSRVGTDGKPIFVKTTTNVGFNLLIAIPFLGNTTMDNMLDVTSQAIAENSSDHVRVIQANTENYWYGFPPFTWIVTPVITDVAIEYQPSSQELGEHAAEQSGKTEKSDQTEKGGQSAEPR
jgi:hypothetical protein